MFVQISRSRIPGKILKLCLIKFGKKKTLENTNSKKPTLNFLISRLNNKNQRPK